jgi:enamine deaminase RidA (YjgF/YER057c/UK114 family)
MNDVNFCIKKIPFYGLDEYYITIKGANLSEEVLNKLFLDLENKDIKILRVFLLGNIEQELDLGEFRKNFPIVVIKNSFTGFLNYGEFSVCINALGGELDIFKLIKKDEFVRGVFLKNKNIEAISISDLYLIEDNSEGVFKNEANDTYKNVAEILTGKGFSLKNVYRFWNFLDDVSETYADFNVSRDAYFQDNSLKVFPAATGIEADLGVHNISLSFDAFKSNVSGDEIFEIISSQMQCEAWEYGPKFSRAVFLSDSETNTGKMIISGTSSINNEGLSILGNDIEKNVVYVMDSVMHLLKKKEMTIDSIISSFVYFKSEDVAKTFEDVYKKNGWNFPYNPILTNICRKNLIFEIECIAAVNLETYAQL